MNTFKRTIAISLIVSLIAIHPAHALSVSAEQWKFRLDQQLDHYFGFSSKMESFLPEIEENLNVLKQEAKPSQAHSELLIKTLITKSWIQFDSKNKNEAEKTLLTIQTNLNSISTHLSLLPLDYQYFANKTFQKQEQTEKAHIKFIGDMNSILVFTNGFYHGQNLQDLSISPGTYRIILVHSDGRTFKKDVKLKAGQTKTVKNNFKSAEEFAQHKPQYKHRPTKMKQKKKKGALPFIIGGLAIVAGGSIAALALSSGGKTTKQNSGSVTISLEGL